MASSHVRGLRTYHATRLGLIRNGIASSKLKKRGGPDRKKLADLMRADHRAYKKSIGKKV